MNTNQLSVVLQTVLEKSGVTKELSEIQKIINSNMLKITPQLEVASIKNNLKDVSREIASTLNKSLGGDFKITGNDVFKALNASMKETAGTASKLATELQKTNATTGYQKYMANNTKITKEAKNQLLEFIRVIESSDDLTRSDLQNMAIQFKNIDASMRDMGKLGLSLGDKFKQTMKKFGGWTLATGTLMTFIYQMKQIPRTVKDVNDVITDLTMATGASKKELQSYIETYSELADELSSTVIDVTISGTEWLKQGKSIAETETLIRSAMVLSKIGKLESAESTKYLTSAMKGYNVEAKDTLDVVDKLSAVDMVSATDVGGLAEGMSDVASAAKLAGISMDKLLGYLAAIGEVTQEGMSGVGTTLNAVFARMGNIKLSRLKDYETGEDLSNVETVLNGLKISLRDSTDSFRDFDDVLDETAGRWDSFSDVQQRAVASAFAGTRNLNSFIVLMENYDNALKYTETSLSSTGSAMEKFDAYQESTAAHLEELNNAAIEFSTTILDSGVINWFIDAGTATTKFGTGLIDLLSPLGTLGAGLGLVMNKMGIGERYKFQW